MNTGDRGRRVGGEAGTRRAAPRGKSRRRSVGGGVDISSLSDATATQGSIAPVDAHREGGGSCELWISVPVEAHLAIDRFLSGGGGETEAGKRKITYARRIRSSGMSAVMMHDVGCWKYLETALSTPCLCIRGVDGEQGWWHVRMIVTTVLQRSREY